MHVFKRHRYHQWSFLLSAKSSRRCCRQGTRCTHSRKPPRGVTCSAQPSTVLAAGSEEVSSSIAGGDGHFGSIQALESPQKQIRKFCGIPKALEVAKPAGLTRSAGTQ